MDPDALLCAPGVEERCSLDDVRDLRLDVLLDEQREGVLGRGGAQAERGGEGGEGREPALERRRGGAGGPGGRGARASGRVAGFSAAAVGVAHDDDWGVDGWDELIEEGKRECTVLDAKLVYGIGQDRERAVIIRVELAGAIRKGREKKVRKKKGG